MSQTFKFLDNKEGKAQDFLKGKMDTVANASEGVIPGGDAYKKYGKMPSDDSSSSSTDSAANNGFTIQGSGTNDNPMYSSGKWGSGSMSPEELAEKFGLDRTSAKNPDGGNKDGDIWGEDAKGNKVYIGTVTDESSLMGNSDLLKAHSSQADAEEEDHNSGDGKLSSSGDLNGAILNLWNGGGASEKSTGEEKEPERTPIEHSEEIKEAKERVRSYEDSVLSGELSNDIYGQQNENKNIVNRVNEKFDLDLDKGVEGIGSAYETDNATNVATDSFLDSKKQDIKNEYQFKPNTNSTTAPDDGSWARQVSREKNLFTNQYNTQRAN